MKRPAELCLLVCAVVALSNAVALAQSASNWTGCVGSVYPCESFQENTCLETAGANRQQYVLYPFTSLQLHSRLQCATQVATGRVYWDVVAMRMTQQRCALSTHFLAGKLVCCEDAVVSIVETEQLLHPSGKVTRCTCCSGAPETLPGNCSGVMLPCGAYDEKYQCLQTAGTHSNECAKSILVATAISHFYSVTIQAVIGAKFLTSTVKREEQYSLHPNVAGSPIRLSAFQEAANVSVLACTHISQIPYD